MLAARYHAFDGPIRVESVPRPSAPPGGVVLEVKATGVCRSDWHGWKGHDSDIVEHGLPTEAADVSHPVGVTARKMPRCGGPTRSPGPWGRRGR